MKLLRTFLAWLDDRTGYRDLVRLALDERILGGARWRYVFGSALVFGLAVQAITGVVLWMAYSPSALTGWESVYYVQHIMAGGWFLRGLHHFTAQAIIVLLALHLIQVVVAGAYRAPREVNFWLGLILMQLILGLCLTGYLLPWDQKGYWATRVATNLTGIVPIVGPALQRLLIGGPEYGHHTLTRFFALHAGVLPALLGAVLALHVWLFRRHGVTAPPAGNRPDGWFWPDQALRDVAACLAVLLTVAGLTVAFHGAPLSAPADPSSGYSAARPEWYFLFLFQLMKGFPGRWEVVGGVVVPGIVLGAMAALPLLARHRLGPRLNGAFVGLLGVAVVFLTLAALRADQQDPAYQAAAREAEADARRVVELAALKGIGASGAVELLREDPLSNGPKLFARHCASCHRYDGHDARGQRPREPPKAADLARFARVDWIARLLDPKQYAGPLVFGGTHFKDGVMFEYLTESGLTTEQVQQVAAALSADAGLPGQREGDRTRAPQIAAGRLWLENEKDAGCAKCHSFGGKGARNLGRSPDLTGYGTRAWILGMLADPRHERFYGEDNDGMPAFGADGILTMAEMEILASWLRGDWAGAPLG